MINSAAKKLECDGIFAAMDQNQVRTRIELATVKIVSKTPGFTGSGVVLSCDVARGLMVVVTAKHNLTVYAKGKGWNPGDPSSWRPGDVERHTTTLINKFKAECEVVYNAADMSADEPTTSVEEGAITDIKFPEAGFTYDVCRLIVSITKKTRPRAEMYDIGMGKGPVDKTITFLRELERTGALPHGWVMVQAGYGRQGQKGTPKYQTMGSLSFRSATLSNGRVGSYHQAEVGAFTDILLLNSAADWTTHEGDSGGPLFALHATRADCHLIGVTTGSDLFPRLQDEPATLAIDPDGKYNNGVSSLLKLYQA